MRIVVKFSTIAIALLFATELEAFVVAGSSPTNSAPYPNSVVVGGENNSIPASYKFSGILAGYINQINANFSAVLSGYNNENNGSTSVISGGVYNQILAPYNTIAGGASNKITESHSTISGGQSNQIMSAYSTISGGVHNKVSEAFSTISGGENNQIFSQYSTVSGGLNNEANNSVSTVSGGQSNQASGYLSTVGGGILNKSKGTASFSVGSENLASGVGSLSMGYKNIASGGHSTAIGYKNTASASYTTALGNTVEAKHLGAMVLGDGQTGLRESTFDNSLSAFFNGGYFFHTAGDITGSTGVSINAGGGAWNTMSDKNKKENFKTVDKQEILDKLVAMPVDSWNYKTQNKNITHIGPYAQDFNKAYGLGDGKLSISTIDSNGIALVSVQALAERNKILNQKNKELEHKMNSLEARLSKIENHL